MKNKIALALGLFLFATAAAYYFLMPAEYFEYAASVDVTNNEREVGFDATNLSFVFGVLPQGTSAGREFNIETNEKRRITIGVSGEIGRWLHLSKNNFALLGKETMQLSIKIPENAKPGHYEGKIAVGAYRTL